MKSTDSVWESSVPDARERRNQELALRIAEEGIVLLKNKGAILPLKSDCRIALLGGGSLFTVKGGTGSGDVNERESVSVYQGIRKLGIEPVNASWLQDYDAEYSLAREHWRTSVLDAAKGDTGIGFFYAYATNPWQLPQGRALLPEDISEADAAIYVISRVSGEGRDRKDQPGDFRLTEGEREQLVFLKQQGLSMIVLLNVGGVMETSFVEELDIDALVVMSQAGMAGGDAVARMLWGYTTPSGKLTDTWMPHYQDYPTAKVFPSCGERVVYSEGLDVGYRYFDKQKEPQGYPFGFGLSYTEFELSFCSAEVLYETASCKLTFEVTNIGETYAGKCTAQVYAMLPKGKLIKELKRLCAWHKTKTLRPHETERCSITFPLEGLASFSTEEKAWVLENGDYTLLLGRSSRSLSAAVCLSLNTDCICKSVHPIIAPALSDGMAYSDELRARYGMTPVHIALEIDRLAFKSTTLAEHPQGWRAREVVAEWTTADMAALVVGNYGKTQLSIIGDAGLTVPGSAGETHAVRDLPIMVLADGTCGLRLQRHYFTVDGRIVPQTYVETLENGIFGKLPKLPPQAKTHDQFCTAFPIGTMLAQTWNPQLAEQFGQAVAEEAEQYGVHCWLAPSMNLHRDPLCGRNFEYLSEDPLLTGILAGHITKGVEASGHVTATIKHFCCNNKEDCRHESDSIVSERTLRELYLRSFEIALRVHRPGAVMTAYNRINGVHAASHRRLLTDILRDEWGFNGFVMTDWYATNYDGSSALRCILAGNDLIMPGKAGESEALVQAVVDGELLQALLRQSAERIVAALLKL